MKKKPYELDENIKQEATADGQLSGVEADPEAEKLEPFDPNQISIETKQVPMQTLVRRLIQGTIRLSPAFQRNEIWNFERKSQLIESLMLKIPLPMFYVSSDKKEHWDVVDGLQRLTTFREFILGTDFLKTKDEKKRGEGFKLQKLEFWGDEYNGKTFNQLPQNISNRILETEFRFTIINPGTQEEVKRNIFKRINTGGMPLTAQEIRHALYQGKSTVLLKELVEDEDFEQAVNNSANDSRMAARELILRFFAFSIRSYKDYPRSANMDKFLCDTMRIINIMPDLPNNELKKIFKDNSPMPNFRFKDIEVLKERFITGMQRAFELFGYHTFRKSFEGRRRAPINKTLFEVWGNLLADLSKEEFDNLFFDKDNFLEKYNKLWESHQFGDLMSRSSRTYAGVQSRYSLLKVLIGKADDMEQKRYEEIITTYSNFKIGD